jgi:hypothetical protein
MRFVVEEMEKLRVYSRFSGEKGESGRFGDWFLRGWKTRDGEARD